LNNFIYSDYIDFIFILIKHPFSKDRQAIVFHKILPAFTN